MKKLIYLLFFLSLNIKPHQISYSMKEIEEILQIIKEIHELQNKTNNKRSKL